MESIVSSNMIDYLCPIFVKLNDMQTQTALDVTYNIKP